MRIHASLLPQGVRIKVNNRPFDIIFSENIWSKAPLRVRQILMEHMSVSSTHFLPLLFDTDTISYNITLPFLESFLFKNQLFDLLSCEDEDKAKHLSYVRLFYNLDYQFAEGDSTFPDFKKIPRFTAMKKPAAVIPFSFGKESLLTFALSQELGIQPVLVYCQEPVQPHEEKYKLTLLTKLKKRYGVPTYFIKNGTGLFRYGKAFQKKIGTELGWGNQTTLLSMMSIPFAYAHHARTIFFGSEYLNNDTEMVKGWKMFLSYDQTASWTAQENNIVRLLTNNQCSVRSSLEPIEELTIFYILHHRYPDIGRFQFSCGAERPLYEGSQWCGKCIKCARMYVFALACQVDPATIGFKENILEHSERYAYYLFDKSRAYARHDHDLNTAFYILYKRGVKNKTMELFVKRILPRLKSWRWHKKYFTTLKPTQNLPPEYEKKLRAIFTQELKNFSRILP